DGEPAKGAASAGSAAEGGSDDSRVHPAAEDREDHSPIPSSRSSAEGRSSAASVYTLDSDGFVVPKKTAKVNPKRGRASPISSVGTVFNEMFYNPEEASDADDEESVSDESEVDETSRPSSPSWADMAEDPKTDPFGPIPEEWSKDPFADIPLDWMYPEATSTPVKVNNESVFDELVEIAVANMTPRARKMWRRRNAKMRDIKPNSESGSEMTEASMRTNSQAGIKEESPQPMLQLAAMRMAVESSGDEYPPRLTAEQKGKGKAKEPVASSSRPSYKATVESVTDDEDPRRAQIRFDEQFAKQVFEQDLIDTETVPTVPVKKPVVSKQPTMGTKAETVTVRYKGSDGAMYEVDLPIEQAFAHLKLNGVIDKSEPSVKSEPLTESVASSAKQKYQKSGTERKSRVRDTQTPARFTTPMMPVRQSTRVSGNANNMVIPEHQMPLNSLLSRMYERTHRASQGSGDPSSSSSDEFDSSPSSSSPSSEDSSDSEGTKKRKRKHRKAWKSKQRKLKLELAATKPEPPEKYNGAANWEKFNEFTILTCKYMKSAYIAPKRQVGKLQTLLTDKAKRFYLQQVAGKENLWTRDSFFVALYNFCFPADFRSQQRERFAIYMQLSLSVREFEAHLRNIAESIGDITPTQFAARFVSGLRPEIREKVKVEGLSGETHSIEVISDYAQRVEASQNAARKPALNSESNRRNGNNRPPRSNGGRSERSENFVKQRGEQREAEPKRSDKKRDLQRTTEKIRKDKPRMSKEERDRHRAEGLCFKCHKGDHIERDCPENHSVKPPHKSLRTMRFDIEECQTRHQLKQAASMGLLAMRFAPICEDSEFLRVRDYVY
ncbi:hypothetical protein AURDEDRAFT_132094, partial [Auricularia subglabra TFB-10046 SS5]